MGSKMFCALVVAAAWSTFNGAEAAYVITLKNGNEFVTGRYWHQGTQVLFETDDGIFGIDKTFVSKVEKTDKPIRRINPPPEAKPIEASQREDSEAKKQPGENQEKPSSKRNEDDPILRHFQGIKERAKNIDGMLSSELTQLAKDLADLKRAMQLSGKTNEFLAEFGELHEIGDRVEEALKARR